MSTSQVNNVTQTVGSLPGSPNTVSAALTIPPEAGKNLVVLFAGKDSSASDVRVLFTQSGTNTQYQVPAGKTLVVYGWSFTSDTSTAYKIGFGHNVASFANGSALSGDVLYQSGTAAADMPFYLSIAANIPNWFSNPVSFPAGAYPFIRQTGGGALHAVLYGYEL